MIGLLSDTGDQLAREAMRRIHADPASHDQETWGRRTECGTVACFAGHVVMAAGGVLDPCGSGRYIYKSMSRDAADLAAILLGLEVETWRVVDSTILFMASNTVADLALQLDQLRAGKHLDPLCWLNP